LISQVFVGQEGFDVEFGEHADRVSAGLEACELQIWAERPLSPKAVIQTARTGEFERLLTAEAV